MSVTLNDPLFNEQYGRVKIAMFVVSLSDSYPIGGSPFETAALDVLGWTTIIDAVADPDYFNTKVIVDKDNWKLITIVQSSGFELGIGINQSSLSTSLFLIGY